MIVAPVTSTIWRLSTEVPLGRYDGLRLRGVANLDNVRQLARDHLRKRIGRARPTTMTALCAVLSTAVDCGPPGRS